MHAVRFESFGDPSVLGVVTTTAPTVDEGTAFGAGHGGFNQSE
jgi:hypothetical protein